MKPGMEPLDDTVDHVRGGQAGHFIVSYGDYVDEVVFVVGAR